MKSFPEKPRVQCLASHLERPSVHFLRSRKDKLRAKELQKKKKKKSTETDRPEAATWIKPPIKNPRPCSVNI